MNYFIEGELYTKANLPLYLIFKMVNAQISKTLLIIFYSLFYKSHWDLTDLLRHLKMVLHALMGI